MISTRLTYGQLMDDARRAAHQGMNTLARDRLPDPGAAQEVVSARAGLLASLGRHATTLIGSTRLAVWRASTPTRRSPDARTPAVVATLAWVDVLDQHATRAPHGETTTAGGGVAAGHWSRATALVECATDLVATHQDPAGGMRPGTPADLAYGDLGRLLASTTRLVAAVAPTEPLALRCREAGITRADVDARLPVGERLLDDTWALARTLRFADSAVADLTLARPTIDVGRGAVEWGQRMARVHARLHQHAQRGHVSVRTLHDIARLGLVTSHVLDTSGRRDHATQSPVTDHWRTVLTHLDPLRSVEPHDRVLRHDVERLLHLARPATTADPTDQQRLLDTVSTSVPLMNACSAIAERVLARSSDVWIPAPPRRPYLRDLHRPGQAARREPPPEAPWPRTGPSPSRPAGLTVT
ncbi:MAG: hypothetical protein Q7V58_11295 [Actinomycetota bacterium]|nr:hypothetical protein [Actinomycetota bacterium]